MYVCLKKQTNQQTTYRDVPPGGGIIDMGIPGGPRGGIIIGAGMPPPMRAGEGPPTPRTGPEDRNTGTERGNDDNAKEDEE